MKKEKKKKLFFVDVSNVQGVVYNGVTVVISEKKLPPSSKRFDGMCTYLCPRIPKHIPIGTIMDIAIGDPIVLRKCIFAGRVRKSKKDTPEEVRWLAENNPIQGLVAFTWKKRRVWVLDIWVSRIEDMRKSITTSDS